MLVRDVGLTIFETLYYFLLLCFMSMLVCELRLKPFLPFLLLFVSLITLSMGLSRYNIITQVLWPAPGRARRRHSDRTLGHGDRRAAHRRVHIAQRRLKTVVTMSVGICLRICAECWDAHVYSN